MQQTLMHYWPTQSEKLKLATLTASLTRDSDQSPLYIVTNSVTDVQASTTHVDIAAPSDGRTRGCELKTIFATQLKAGQTFQFH